MATKSLLARNNDIANTARQLEILSNGIFANGELPTFVKKIKELFNDEKQILLDCAKIKRNGYQVKSRTSFL